MDIERTISISINGTQYLSNTVGIVDNAFVTVNAFAYLMIFGTKLFTLCTKLIFTLILDLSLCQMYFILN